MLSNTIRENFDRFREEKGLTVAEIAAAKGVTRQTIYSYFREGITLGTLQKVADIVGVEPWQLLAPPTMQHTHGNGIKCPNCGVSLNIHLTADNVPE